MVLPPPRILSEAEVTELAELWARALGALSEYVEEHSERELTPTDLDLVTADQQSIEQLERRFPPDLTDIWSLSPLQSGMLFHAQFDETEIDPYMVQLTLELGGGRVEAPRLRRAAQALVDRHPSLRAGFVSAPGGRALQVIRSGADIGWAEIDLSGGAEDSEVAFGQLLERDRAHRFYMETAPLIRFMLVRIGPDTARLVVTNHHILLDGWSTPLLLRDLLTLYATDGDPEILPRVQSYRDYLSWISKQEPRLRYGRGKKRYGGVDTSTHLSRADTAAETVASEIHSYSLPTERAETLRAFARSRGLTMATLVQVAWGGIVLAELLGRDDVVFGGTVSGRPPQVPGVESIVGLFINTVPVRVRLDARETLAEMAIRVQSEQASLLDHHHIGLSDIAGAVGAAGSFDTLTVFESYPVDETALTAETDIAGMHVLGIDGRDSAHYPIAVVASESDTLNLKMEYLPTHFSAREVAKITERVGIVLGQLASAPDQPLARLQVLTEFESRDLAPVFGSPPGRSARTLPEILADVSATYPDRIALSAGSRSMTYAELDRRSNQLARAMIRRGAGPETSVAIGIERSVESVLAVWAVAKTGAAFVPPVDPHLSG